MVELRVWFEKGPSLMWTHHDFEEATSHLGQLKVEETQKKTTELLLVKFF